MKLEPGAAQPGLSYGMKKRPKKTVKKAAMRQVLIYTDEDNKWVAECPSLPGCVSQGRTREKTIENIREAIAAYIEALEIDGLPVPEDKFNALLIAI